MLKLLLVLTGGTISTIVQGQVMGIHENSPYLILEKYQERNNNGAQKDFPEFDVIEPIRMLSECSRPAYLEQIYYGILEALGLGKNAMEVREKRGKFTRNALPYDGIIVTHGSDTLSYTAAFLSTVFSWISIPLVLTAADYPLSDERSNGLKNFSDSVDFIRQKALPGVFVIWQNKTAGETIFLAEELLEADNYQDCFSSYSGQAFGEIKQHFCKNKKLLDFHMEHEVLFLRPYPGLRYDLIALENTNIRAVVHYLYHSATACVDVEALEGADSAGSRKEKEFYDNKSYYNILTFAKYCKTLGIDVYFAGFKKGGQRFYETNDLLLKSGLGKPLYNVSPELAYMSVLVAYNQTSAALDEIFN